MEENKKKEREKKFCKNQERITNNKEIEKRKRQRMEGVI